MNLTLSLIRSGHPHLALAAHVEGLPDLWVGRDWPLGTPAGYTTTRSVLAIKELAPTSGSGDPFRGLADPAQVTVHLQDPTGYIQGLFSSGTQTTLAAEVGPTDTTISLTDASSFANSGSGYLQREAISWTGKSGNDLTGVSRALYSDREAGTYPMAGEVLPPYRVGTTPMWLDGRIITIWAIPTTRDGDPLGLWADRLMVWRGVITSAPYSLSGIDWSLGCAGLERLLQGGPAVGTSKATLPGGLAPATSTDSGIYVTEAADTIYIHMRILVLGVWYGQTISYTVPTGRFGDAQAQGLADWFGDLQVGAGLSANIQRTATGWIFRSLDNGNSTMISPVDAPNSLGGQFAGYRVWSQYEQGPLGLRLAHYLELSNGAAYYVPATATKIPIFVVGALDWPDGGLVEIRGEQIGYGDVEYAGEVGDGRLLYYLTNLTRSVNGEVASDYRAPDPGDDGPEVTPGLSYQGDSSVEATYQTIAGLPGLGDEFISSRPPTLEEEPLPSGPLDSLLQSGNSIGDAIGDSAALDGCMIAAGIDDDGQYRLLATRPGNQEPVSRQIAIDWDGHTGTRSGLGQSVTSVVVRLADGSQVTAHDWPTLLAVGQAQSRQLTGQFRPSVDSLTAAGGAGYALLRKWGRPGLILDCELGPEYRDLRVGDNVSLVLPDGLDRQWVVLQTTPSWAGKQPHCRVSLWQCHTWDTVWYAPVAEVESVDGDTITCTIEDTTYSPWRPGELALQIEWFSVGDQVRFLDPVNDSDGVSAFEILAINLATGKVELDGAPGAVTGHYMIHESYSAATATSQDRYAWIAATGTEYHQWGG
jgi:hypothetical protein